MLPLHTHGTLTGTPSASMLKVLDIGEALTTEIPRRNVVVDLRAPEVGVDAGALADLGFAAVLGTTAHKRTPLPLLHSLRDDKVVAAGDAIRLWPTGRVSVLFRRGANANSLFVTERCNSFCLMCSQPPRDDNDDWRVDEILELIPLIDKTLPSLGVTGGEPTLLGSNLLRILQRATEALPDTGMHVLTNGRHFSDVAFAESFSRVRERTTWAIPLYADTASKHDYVVQADGAFDETVAGIYNLAEQKHQIEVRLVLHAVTVPRLAEFAEFLWRNMPFVAHVALMGLEPMGFAKLNRDTLWIDPADYAERLSDAVHFLHDRGFAVSIYNVPLCVLPEDGWPFARQSISDWKNVFDPICDTCSVKNSCSGFFRSAGSEWRSRNIRPIETLTQ